MKRKKITTKEEALKRIKAMKVKRLNEEKAVREKKLRKKVVDALSPEKAFAYKVKLLYFSKLDSDMVGAISKFFEGIAKEVRTKNVELFTKELKELSNTKETFKKLIDYRVKFMELPVTKVNTTKLNGLGKLGWSIAYFFEDKVILQKFASKVSQDED